MIRRSAFLQGIAASACCLMFLTPSVAGAQTFHDEAKRAAGLVKAGSYGDAAGSLERAFGILPVPAALYNAACYRCLAGDTAEAMADLQRAANAGYSDIDLTRKDPDLAPLHGSPAWSSALSRIRTNREGVLAAYGKSFRTRFEQLYYRTLSEYADADSIRRNFGRDSKEMVRFVNDTARRDSLDFPALVDTIRAHGWPGKSAIGSVASGGLYFAFQRAPVGIQEAILPSLWLSAYAGEVPILVAAEMEDSIRLATGRPQLYGTQIDTNPDTGEQTVCLTEDPDAVDARRIGAGLDSIRVSLAEFGVTWNPDRMKSRLAARKTGEKAPAGDAKHPH